eukprot:g1807.t1
MQQFESVEIHGRRYYLSALLGQGAYGRVFASKVKVCASEQAGEGEILDVAVKEIKAGSAFGGLPDMTLERLLYELRCLAQIPRALVESKRAPTLVGATCWMLLDRDSTAERGRSASHAVIRLAMTRIPGTSLNDVAEKVVGGWECIAPVEFATKLIADIARVMETADFVHRDINSRNILFVNRREKQKEGKRSTPSEKNTYRLTPDMEGAASPDIDIGQGRSSSSIANSSPGCVSMSPDDGRINPYGMDDLDLLDDDSTPGDEQLGGAGSSQTSRKNFSDLSVYRLQLDLYALAVVALERFFGSAEADEAAVDAEAQELQKVSTAWGRYAKIASESSKKLFAYSKASVEEPGKILRHSQLWQQLLNFQPGIKLATALSELDRSMEEFCAFAMKMIFSIAPRLAAARASRTEAVAEPAPVSHSASDVLMRSLNHARANAQTAQQFHANILSASSGSDVVFPSAPSRTGAGAPGGTTRPLPVGPRVVLPKPISASATTDNVRVSSRSNSATLSEAEADELQRLRRNARRKTNLSVQRGVGALSVQSVVVASSTSSGGAGGGLRMSSGGSGAPGGSSSSQAGAVGAAFASSKAVLSASNRKGNLARALRAACSCSSGRAPPDLVILDGLTLLIAGDPDCNVQTSSEPVPTSAEQIMKQKAALGAAQKKRAQKITSLARLMRTVPGLVFYTAHMAQAWHPENSLKVALGKVWESVPDRRIFMQHGGGGGRQEAAVDGSPNGRPLVLEKGSTSLRMERVLRVLAARKVLLGPGIKFKGSSMSNCLGTRTIMAFLWRPNLRRVNQRAKPAERGMGVEMERTGKA